MNSIKQALIDVQTAEGIVDKHIGKPALDIEEGRFRIEGSITLGKIFRRKRIGTNLALSSGYLLKDCVTGDTLYVEKQQGVQLSMAYGARNAFVSYRKRPQKDAEGTLLQEKQSIYLQPYPQREESFTRDDRVTTAFKLDSAGDIIRPFVLNLKEEECTEELWRIVQAQYKRGSHVSKRSHRGKKAEHLEKIANIREALKTGSIPRIGDND